jgi:hypothetical protein
MAMGPGCGGGGSPHGQITRGELSTLPLTPMNTSKQLPAGQAERRCDTRAVRSTRMAMGRGSGGGGSPHGQITRGELSTLPLTPMNTSKQLPAGQAERRCDARAVRSICMAMGVVRGS